MTKSYFKPMTWKKIAVLLLLLSLLAAVAWRLSMPAPDSATGKQQAEAEHQHESGEQHATSRLGQHGGELIAQAGYTLEALWSEQDEQVSLRFWLYQGEQLLDNQAIKVEAQLERLDGKQQALSFKAEANYLQSQQSIAAPHAFNLHLQLSWNQQTLKFDLQRSEGVLKLSPQQIQAAAISIAQVEKSGLQTRLELPGEIKLNQDRTAHVVPRIAGVVESVHADLGQPVKKGQLLAVISSPAASEQRSELQTAQQRLALAQTTFTREKRLWEQKVAAEQDYQQAAQALSEAQVAVNNARQKLAALGLSTRSAQGLNRFELRAPFDGMVIEKHLSLGEAVKEDTAVFTVSDLSQVWAEINITAKDLALIKTGTRVDVLASALNASAKGSISYVGALLGEQSRSAKARVLLNNPDGAWRPGLFVTISLAQSETEATLHVLAEAVQQIEQNQVVFVQVPGGFLAQTVKTGRSDGQRLEILSGLSEGQRYAANGSFILKSELGKASAEHSH